MKDTIETSYNIFMRSINSKVIKYATEYHNDISIAISYYDILCNTITDLQLQNEFKSNDIYSITIKSFHKMYRKYKGIDSVMTLTQILYKLIFYRIRYYHNLIKFYNYIMTIDYKTFLNIITDYNVELVNHVLLGNTVKLRCLGNISIATLYRTDTTKVRVNFNETKKYQKLYAEQNIDSSPTVFYNDSTYEMFRFCRAVRNSDLSYYAFEPTNFNNMLDRKIESYYSENNKESDILCNSKIGVIQKMNSLIKKDYKYKANYINNGTKLYNR